MISYGYHHLVSIDIDTNKTYLKEMMEAKEMKKFRVIVKVDGKFKEDFIAAKTVVNLTVGGYLDILKDGKRLEVTITEYKPVF